MTLRTARDLDTLVLEAADEVVAILAEAIATRGVAHVALAGGSTARRLYAVLATRAVDWTRVEVWWGDERVCAAAELETFYRTALGPLFEHVGARLLERQRPAAEARDAADAAAAYEAALVATLGEPPVLDLVILGLGTDGHTASLMPDSPALASTRWVDANPVPGMARTRITFTAPTLCAARHVRVLVAGRDKAEVLAAILEGPAQPERYPAQLLVGAATDVAWLADEAAAARRS